MVIFTLNHLFTHAAAPAYVGDGGEVRWQDFFGVSCYAVVLSRSSPLIALWRAVAGVSTALRNAAEKTPFWRTARAMELDLRAWGAEAHRCHKSNAARPNSRRERAVPDIALLNEKARALTVVEGPEEGAACWAASSTTREEGKLDKWQTCALAPGGQRTVTLVRGCVDEGISYDLVRWVGCLQGMRHPCIASLQLARVQYDPDMAGTWVHAAFEHVDTSLQRIVYRTLERTPHTVLGRPLPDVMLRSFMYQLLSALACCHARGIPHGNLAPYRVLAKVLDAEKDQYLLKLADFGFSPPAAAMCNEELPIRPSRASPELGAEHERKRYGPANDLWALGTVFAEVACGSRDPTVYMMIQDLERTDEPTLKAHLPMFSDEARALLRALLRAEPSERITAADALAHPYFDGLHDDCAVVARYLPRSRPPPPRFLDVRAEPAWWQPGFDFIGRQGVLSGKGELNARMWTILYDWLSVVSHKFKFVPRSLQLACECMKRYMAVVPVTRKRLQLVGIGALCLTCKHEEVMIPNMNDFIYICDNAYELDALLQIEVEILSALNMQLHVPTPHDQLLPLLRAIGEAPLNAYPEAIEFSRLRSWCECMLLLGQAHYPVVLHDGAVLARAVGTLGALLSRGVAETVVGAGGEEVEGNAGGALRDRACWLRGVDEWACLKGLVEALEAAVENQRELLKKCHAEFVAPHELKETLAQYEHAGDDGFKTAPLKAREVEKLINKHYPVKDMRAKPRNADGFNPWYEADFPEGAAKRDKIFLRHAKGKANIVAVTCALGKQLLLEHSSGMDP